MIFTETKLKGAFIIDLDRKTDERGFFARAFCQNEFRDHGLKPVIAQANVASNAKKGTLRGMHFQYPPAAESKLVRCTRGAILDIIVDLRPESPTYLEHISVELNEDNMTALYVPERFAHGYQALRDNTDTSYQVGEFYTPNAESGLRHDDPRLGLKWPLPVSVMSPKDQAFRPLREIEDEVKRRAERNVARSRRRLQDDVWRGQSARSIQASQRGIPARLRMRSISPAPAASIPGGARSGSSASVGAAAQL